MRPSLFVLLLVEMLACGPHDVSASGQHHAAVTPPRGHPQSEPPTTGAGPTAGEGNGVAIHATPSTGEVAISVAVTGTAEVALAPRIRVERRRGDAWEEVTGIAGLTLRPDCAHDAPECVHLAPGAELLPPSWLGTWGDAQCICARCGRVEAGTYRFVLTTCDGARRYLGEPFELRSP